MVAFAAVVPLSFVCVNTWDMNGVSFAGTGACLAGVAYLSFALVAAVRKRPHLCKNESLEHDHAA